MPTRAEMPQSMGTTTWSYTEKDVILYALSLGCKWEESQYVYENASDFAVLPTFGVLPLHNGGALEGVKFEDLIPNYSPMNVLHGEQYLEVKRQIPKAATLVTDVSVTDIIDKDKFAVAIIALTSKLADSEDVVFYNETAVVIRGAGGFGKAEPRPRNPAAVANYPVPDREPDAAIEETVSQEAAALYRLCGDENPLHIDPEFAGLAGYEKPILHGLCTFGIAGKHVLKAFANGQPAAMKSIKGRMAKHVFPGDTLRTEMWLSGADTVVLQVKVLGRDVVVLSNAAVILHQELMSRTSRL